MERNEIKTLYLPKNAQVGIFRIVRRIQRQNYERLCWRAAAPLHIQWILSTLSSPAVLTEYIHDQLPVTINEMETTAQTKEKHCLA